MKKILILCIASTIITFGWAQGKEKKSKKSHDKEYKHSNKSDDKNEKDDKIFGRNDDNTARKDDDDRQRKDEGYNKSNKKYSKNQPAKVRAAFENDYPNATNVRWTKSRGDWTATFINGVLRNRTQVTYHANGERTDSRTRKDNDQSSVFDRIFKRGS